MLFGGRSEEHAVSLRSAESVLSALDPERFEAVPVGISRDGRWLMPGDAALALRAGPGRSDGQALTVAPGTAGGALVPARSAGAPVGVDVVFPVLHGPNGEDGTIQGVLETAGLPYVGAGVLGSAVGMDKIMQKDVLVRHALPVVDYVPVSRHEFRRDPGGVADAVQQRLGLPCFVKPANLGSSVGVTRAHSEQTLLQGLRLAAEHDRRLLCERAVIGLRELECAVLGNEDPETSVVGEVIPRAQFYDYESKYSPDGARLVVPADVPPPVADRIAELAVRAFAVLDCAGMARVDFFLEGDSDLWINEVNTIPGFTATSMYPRLWAASGLAYRDLLTRLVDLAIERHAARRGDTGPDGRT